MLKGWIPENREKRRPASETRGPETKVAMDFLQQTSEQKWHKTKDLLNFVLLDGKNAFSGKKTSEMRNTQTDFPAIPSEIG